MRPWPEHSSTRGTGTALEGGCGNRFARLHRRGSAAKSTLYTAREPEVHEILRLVVKRSSRYLSGQQIDPTVSALLSATCPPAVRYLMFAGVKAAQHAARHVFFRPIDRVETIQKMMMFLLFNGCTVNCQRLWNGRHPQLRCRSRSKCRWQLATFVIRLDRHVQPVVWNMRKPNVE